MRQQPSLQESKRKIWGGTYIDVLDHETRLANLRVAHHTNLDDDTASPSAVVLVRMEIEYCIKATQSIPSYILVLLFLWLARRLTHSDDTSDRV